MEEESVSKAVSCISCAKRKVRCDRLEPCSNCKRRSKKGDVCEYPLTQPALNNYQISQQARIQQLEQYILRHGGNVDLSDQTASTPTRGTKRSYDDTRHTTETSEAMAPHLRATLVEQDKQSTYVEACAIPHLRFATGLITDTNPQPRMVQLE